MPRHFRTAPWALAAAVPLGSALVIFGVMSAVSSSKTEQVGAVIFIAMGAIILLALQVRITVTADEIRIRHLVFARRVPVVDIAELSTRKGVDADRVAAVTLRLRSGREVSLRPAGSQIDALIAAIEEARELRRV